jgi:hypothetical protein
MPYEMNEQEKLLWKWECRNNIGIKRDYIGLKYNWWQEGEDVVFDMIFIPTFKKLWKDYVSENT